MCVVHFRKTRHDDKLISIPRGVGMEESKERERKRKKRPFGASEQRLSFLSFFLFPLPPPAFRCNLFSIFLPGVRETR